MLRILAMFLVLVVHADFFSLGSPTQLESQTSPVSSFLSFFTEELSIVCVDVFVLISGWFGIKPKVKGFCNFLFQCFFFYVGLYALLLLTGVSEFSIKGFASCLVLTKHGWFIKSYIGLYILSPILNMFIEHSSKKQFEITLISFFVFQSIFGWFSEATNFIVGGYSTFSFIGLYLLARYVRLYPCQLSQFKPRADLLIYFSIVLASSIIMFSAVSFVPRFGASIAGRFTSYVSPTVIISSLYLLLFFSKLNVQSRVVNWFAASSFAVYLLHTNPEILDRFFKSGIVYLHDSFSTPAFVGITFFVLIAIFIVAVLIDQIRIALWKVIEKRI